MPLGGGRLAGYRGDSAGALASMVAEGAVGGTSR